jgi:hypothetical protein
LARRTKLGVPLVAALACAGLAAAAFAGVHKYDSKLTISGDPHVEKPGRTIFHGKVKSPFRKCEGGRRVVLFKQRRGADRKLGSERTPEQEGIDRGTWSIGADVDSGVYAKVRRDHDRNPSGNGYVCRADRAPNQGTI